MRVLVTGGAGFIGGNLVRSLVATAGVEEVRVLDDLSTGHEHNLRGCDVDLRVETLLDMEAVHAAMAGMDAVVHLAAIASVPHSLTAPVATHAANVTGTLHVLEAARAQGTPHVLLASSSSVYGANPELPKGEHLRCEPASPYAVSKLAAEAYALSYARCYALPVLPFRFFNVYGPLQAPGHAYAAVVPRFIDAAVAGRPLPINGDGTQTRDFTYVDTVTQIIVEALMRRRVSNGAINLALGTRHTLLDVAANLEQVLGRQVGRQYLPPRPADILHSQADSRRLRELFPDVVPVTLSDGLRSTVEWFVRTRFA